jgi:hypothetical protein
MELLDFGMRRYSLVAVDLQNTMEVQLPFLHLLPASAGEISRAIQKGAVLDPSSGLCKPIAGIAVEMAATRPSTKKPSAVRDGQS